jgi:fructose/tagatose bisphosphate aldolase
MNHRIRRQVQVYVLHGLATSLVIYKIFNSESILGISSMILFLGVGLISFANIIINKYYNEVSDSSIVIHQDYFRTFSINLNEIDKIEIEPGPFKFSSILLKDKSKVKFNDNYIDIRELKEAMSNFKISVC